MNCATPRFPLKAPFTIKFSTSSIDWTWSVDETFAASVRSFRIASIHLTISRADISTYGWSNTDCSDYRVTFWRRSIALISRKSFSIVIVSTTSFDRIWIRLMAILVGILNPRATMFVTSVSRCSASLSARTLWPYAKKESVLTACTRCSASY